jgi:hypothetical protein
MHSHLWNAGHYMLLADVGCNSVHHHMEACGISIDIKGLCDSRPIEIAKKCDREGYGKKIKIEGIRRAG